MASEAFLQPLLWPFTAPVCAQGGRFSLTEESRLGSDISPSCHTARVPVPVDCGEVGSGQVSWGGGIGPGISLPTVRGRETAYGVQGYPLVA